MAIGVRRSSTGILYSFTPKMWTAERVAPSGVHLTPPPWARTSPARPKSAETDFSSRGTRPFPLAARSGHCPTRRHLQEAGAGSASNAAVEERHHPLSEGAPTGSGRQSPLLALLFVSLHIKVFHLERVLLDEVAPWLHLV